VRATIERIFACFEQARTGAGRHRALLADDRGAVLRVPARTRFQPPDEGYLYRLLRNPL